MEYSGRWQSSWVGADRLASFHDERPALVTLLSPSLSEFYLVERVHVLPKPVVAPVERIYVPPVSQVNSLWRGRESRGAAVASEAAAFRVRESDLGTAPLPGSVADLIREKGAQGAAEFLADKVEPAISDKVLALWPSGFPGGPAGTAEGLLAAKYEVHEQIGCLVSGSFPAGHGAAAVITGRIAQYTPIEMVDSGLGKAALLVEMFGFVGAVLSGNPVLAGACLKRLIHDLAHRAVAAGVKAVLSGGHHDEGEMPQHQIAAVPECADRDVEDHAPPTGASAAAEPSVVAVILRAGPANGTETATTQLVTGSADGVGSVHWTPKASRRPVDFGGRAECRTDGAVLPVGTRHPGSGVAASRTDSASSLGSRRPEAMREGSHASGPLRRTEGSAGPDGPITAPVGYLTFVRLCLHYELASEPGSAARDHPEVQLARLVIVRDSRRFAAPEPVVSTDRSVLAQEVEHVTAALARTGTPRAWRIRDHGDAQAVTLTAESAGALLAKLSRTIIGPPPKADLEGFVIEHVPVGPGLDQLTSATRCVEILAINSASGKTPTLLALAVAAPVQDKFWEVITSATRQ
jgi:hypothetical protein